jgi:hypothetical protein
MQELIQQFNKEYDYLYEHDNVAGYSEAVKWFDENQNKLAYKDLVSSFVKARGDFISSDREAAAFTFALETLNFI